MDTINSFDLVIATVGLVIGFIASRLIGKLNDYVVTLLFLLGIGMAIYGLLTILVNTLLS